MSTSKPIETLELFGRLRRNLNLIATQALKPFGVGPKQAILIRYVFRNGSSCLAELSRATATDPAATGRAIEVMVKKGWVRQSEHPSDRRRWQVMLTSKGQELASQIERVFDTLAGQLLEPLTATESRAFHAILEKLLDRLPAEASK